MAVYPDYNHSRVLLINVFTGATTAVATAPNPTEIVVTGTQYRAVEQSRVPEADDP